MTVKVRRERPDQRRHHRVTAPLFLRVGDGPVVRARDWSLGGIRVDDYPEDLPKVGSEVELSVTLPFQGFDISFVAKARIIRSLPDIKSFAAEFTELGDREQQLLHHFVEDLVKGAMSEVAESIQRIDVPITPVSTEPDPKNDTVVKKKTIPVRQVAWVGVYSAIGFVVFGYMALVLYSNIFRMEVQTAVVESPMVEIRAQSDGELSFVRASAGDEVTRGETVIYLADYSLEKQIEMAQLEIHRREAELVTVMQSKTAEMEKMNEYASVGLKNIEQIKFDMESLRARLHAAKARHRRTRNLMKEGWATKSQLEEANQFLAEARSRLKSKSVELKEQIRLNEAGLGKRFFNGREILGKTAEIDAKLKLARYQISLAHRQHEALLKHRERLAVRAPFDGRLLKLFKPELAAVKQGDTIAVFEDNNVRQVQAYLTQDEVMKVGMGDTASVYFPALNQSVKGKVVAIDRTKGFRQEIARRYSWRSPDDRSAEITLDFENPGDPLIKQHVQAGMPAVVLFEARSTNPILAAMWRKVAALFL